VQKTIEKGTVKKPHESITEEGTVKKLHLEICASQGNSVAMHSPDSCNGGSSGVTGVQGESNRSLRFFVQPTGAKISHSGGSTIAPLRRMLMFRHIFILSPLIVAVY